MGPGVLHADEPDWVGAFVGGGVAVEEVPHCLVEVAINVFCGGLTARTTCPWWNRRERV